MANSEVKIYKITGKYVKKHQKFKFTKYVRALTPENALDKVLGAITSQRILRRKIEIVENTEVSLDECPDLYIRGLANL
ncbi:MAG: 50S ribosomal protein L18a [Candidatus Lokiarchaeota archaeon]|nr:50S ribosomal protein L18a [Candidatus Harpocratesius repetitus]